jgi:hypothetical protein
LRGRRDSGIVEITATGAPGVLPNDDVSDLDDQRDRVDDVGEVDGRRVDDVDDVTDRRVDDADDVTDGRVDNVDDVTGR